MSESEDVFAWLHAAVTALADLPDADIADGCGPLDRGQLARAGRARDLLEDVLGELNAATDDDDAFDLVDHIDAVIGAAADFDPDLAVLLEGEAS